MMAGSIAFDIIARDKASAVFSKVGNSASQSSSKVEKLHKAGAIAGRALAVGLAAAGVAAVKFANAAAEDEQAQVKLATALRNATGATDGQIASVERWITAQGKALGVSDDELRPALSRLAVATGDVGEAQKLASLAMDVSAGTGKSLQTVTEALVKAQNGSLGGLSRLGVATKDAEGKTKSLRDITKDLATTYEGAASRSSDTVAGKQKILKVQMGELQEEIGARLLPALLKLSEVGLKVVDWISKNQTVAAIFLGTIVAMTAAVWAVSAATKAWAAVMVIANAATKVWAATQWLLNAALAANPIGLVIIAIAALVAAIVIAYKKSSTFRAIVKAAFDTVKAAGTALKTKLVAAFNNIKAGLEGLWSKAQTARDKIGAAFGTIKDKATAVVDWIKGIPGKLKDLGEKFKEAGQSLINKFVDGMKNAAGIISGISGNVWSAVKSLLNGAIGKINSALEFTISLPGPDLHIDVPNIPYLAKGGIVTRPTLAMIGEAGPEAVVPLRGPHAPRMARNAGDTILITVSGALDPVSVANQIDQLLARRKRVSGGRLAFERV